MSTRTKYWQATLQYFGDEGEVGEVGEYFGEDGDIWAGAINMPSSE
jgi:hypothetical protein